jgi:hypothetical protein
MRTETRIVRAAGTKFCIWHLRCPRKMAIPEDNSLNPGAIIMSEAQSGVAAVDRALLILSAFREDDAALSLALLARRTGLYKSTILRLLQSLLRAGYVVRLPDGNYVIGPEPAKLARMSQPAPESDTGNGV